MKNLSLLFMVFLFFKFTSIAQQGWFWQNPLPQGNDLNDVWVKDQNTIFAVGDRGTLLKSDDAGLDWQITYKLEGISEDIVDVQFIDDQKGWLLATNIQDYYSDITQETSTIFSTTDGGINWNIIADFDSLRLNDLSFIDGNIGWVVGYVYDGNNTDKPMTGMVLKTADGGFSWDTLFVQSGDPWTPSYKSYSSIQFINPDTGWIAGKAYTAFTEGELLRTTDGGINWSVINDSMDCITSMQFLSSDLGWLIQVYGAWGGFYQINKTTDGGLSWEVVFQGFCSYSIIIPAVFFIDNNNGWIVEPGFVHKTTDGGNTWSTDTINCPQYWNIFWAMHFSDEMNGCIVGKFGQVLNTQDGGELWTPKSSFDIVDNFTSVDFYNQDVGWAAGYTGRSTFEGGETDGRIYKTTDGGFSWQEELCVRGSYTTDGSCYVVQTISEQIVYAASSSIYKSVDGGSSWSQMNPGGDWSFRALFFLNADTGFVSHGNTYFTPTGNVYKTTDGGNSWTYVFSAANTIESIFFADNSVGWAVGWIDSIYKTVDGGDTWQAIPIDTAYLKSVYFTDSNNGWTVGMNWEGSINENEGIIMKTTDGGYNWNLIYTYQGYCFNSVYFIDSLRGFTIGSGIGGGIILSTTNGGLNWVYQLEGTSKGLNDIFFNNYSIAWAVGEGGTILKTTTGGTTFIREEEIKKIPNNYFLNQNYPNPFNPRTKIKYSIPQTSGVVLKVFDILGNEIETLVEEERPAGTYEVTWNADNLPSGVYFYQLKAGEYVETKKMILLR